MAKDTCENTYGGRLCTLFEVLEGVALSRDYGPLVKSLEPSICVKPSIEAAGTGAPLFSVRLLRDLNAERRFALVVSANHSLVDGHGFYRLYNMLSSESKVEALDPTRKQELPARMLAAMGDEPSPMTACPPGFLASFVFAQVRSQLFPRTKAIGFDISAEWLAAQKATAAKEMREKMRNIRTNFRKVKSDLSSSKKQTHPLT
mgnify:CR=1 FL=1